MPVSWQTAPTIPCAYVCIETRCGAVGDAILVVNEIFHVLGQHPTCLAKDRDFDGCQLAVI